MNSNTPPIPRFRISVSKIGEFIRFQSCERRIKLDVGDQREIKQFPFEDLFYQTLIDPVLQAVGRLREDEWEASLLDQGCVCLTEGRFEPGKGTNWTDFLEKLKELPPEQLAYGREVTVEGIIGTFNLSGQIDFVVICWVNGRPRLRLVECKASRKDRTYHRIQLACYKLLVLGLLQRQRERAVVGKVPLLAEELECVVVRIDEGTNQIQNVLGMEPLDLQSEIEDLQTLLAPDGLLEQVLCTDLQDIPFQLDSKCNDCVYAVHCLLESARERRLELLGLDSWTVRVLKAEGINSLDSLATLNLESDVAARIRRKSGFSENLAWLKQRAKTRLRRLPGEKPEGSYDVAPLPNSGYGQLPVHEVAGRRLVRVYLTVEYDYVENRVVALVAHVTKSKGQLQTGFIQVNGKWQTDPEIKEVEGDRVSSVSGVDVVKMIDQEWSGDFGQDTDTERALIESFFIELSQAIWDVAEADEAPLHFYIWARQEMTQLIEGCTRCGSELLSCLQELMGCREKLEQLIYSSLQDEMKTRYAIAWSGEDLAVASSLQWFGQRYHWTRLIEQTPVNLDQEFRQDVFDFRHFLKVDQQGNWSENPKDESFEFEVRLRLFKSLSSPYWRAYWGKLQEADERVRDKRVRNAVKRYNNAAKRLYLQEYLKARAHFLRWMDERIQFKNEEIEKPVLRIPDLRTFSLGVNSVRQAAVDFLRLDHHVKMTKWIAEHLIPPLNRLQSGRTIPVRNLRLNVSGRDTVVVGQIDLERAGVDPEVFRLGCTIEEDGFVRLSPCFEDLGQGQTVKQLIAGGATCVVKQLDFERGQIVLSVISTGTTKDNYLLYSKTAEKVQFHWATVDESPSDFVAGKVEERLKSKSQSHIYEWLDPTNPVVPKQVALDQGIRELCEGFVRRLRIPRRGGESYSLAPDQGQAILDGLRSRIQLLQGPPGTGKTETTAIAIFLRIYARCRAGVVLVTAPTHTAVDTILRRLQERLPVLYKQAKELGMKVPKISLVRLEARDAGVWQGTEVAVFGTHQASQLVQIARNGVVLIGGTTSSLLKLYRNSFLDAAVLMLDEASMMVFPHFLALATLLKGDGEMMLAGDHRQLAPIVAHAWETEDRPPVIRYQPFVSAYEAILQLKQRGTAMELSDEQIRCSALSYTFRLPQVIQKLIAGLYAMDGIQLTCPVRPSLKIELDQVRDPWVTIWEADGLFLVLHDERESRDSNQLEVEVIRRILLAAGDLPADSVALVTPHRAQRTLLKASLEEFYGERKPVEIIDTVERLQGDERPTIIMSASVSDPTVIAERVEFILDLNRSNVAFSRPQNRLIIVCASSLVDFIPNEIEDYQETMLWKALRSLCSVPIGEEVIQEWRVSVLVPECQVSYS